MRPAGFRECSFLEAGSSGIGRRAGGGGLELGRTSDVAFVAAGVIAEINGKKLSREVLERL